MALSAGAPAEQADELSDLVVGKPRDGIAIAFKERRDGRRQTPERTRGQRDAAAAPVGRFDIRDEKRT